MEANVKIAVNLDKVYKNEHIKTSNLKINRTSFTIKDIFLEYWASFHHKFESRIIRPEIDKNIDAFLKCGSYENGFLFYTCPNCNKYHISAFSCKSRFCPSCAHKYRDARALSMLSKCVNTEYRHMVFTIPEELRIYFLMDRSLLNLLFESVNSVFKFMLKEKHKGRYKDGYQNGFMCALHTFGRDLKWNPHIHCLMSEVLINKDGKTSPYKYFHYVSLRKSFMKCLLDLLYNEIKTKEFYQLKCQLYKHKGNGFYVYAPKIQLSSFKHSQIKSLVEYVTRYASHPPMSEARITNIDWDNDTVSYYYDPHEDDSIQDDKLKRGRQFVTEHVFTFIGKLIKHIPPKSFHTIRYYGFFSNRSLVSTDKVSKLFNNNYIYRIKKLLGWRHRLIKTFNYDPILCDCGFVMELDYENCYFP